jgi:hypothetical protein
MLLLRSLLRQRRCHNVLRSLTTQSSDDIRHAKQAEDQWMRSQECHKLLEQFFTPPSSHLSHDSLETYLQARGFSHILENEIAMRVVSMVLTNPLTISHALRQILPPTMTSARALCIGARSESNLPLVWWRESLISLPTLKKLSVEMCGPEIQHHCHGEKTLFEISNETISTQSFELSSPPINKCHFHRHPTLHEKLLLNDIFFLMNPGYGANDLMKLQWKQTLQLLLSTKKMIVCTAHSSGDLERDLKYLDELTSEEDEEGLQLGDPIEMILSPQRNPYRSLSLTYDQKENDKCKIVQTNDHLYAFRMK